jgi:hypothetical protein
VVEFPPPPPPAPQHSTIIEDTPAGTVKVNVPDVLYVCVWVCAKEYSQAEIKAAASIRFLLIRLGFFIL